jgi:hypothetical protein
MTRENWRPVATRFEYSIRLQKCNKISKPKYQRGNLQPAKTRIISQPKYELEIGKRRL